MGFLEQSVTSSDNPYLRTNVHAIKSHQMEKKKSGKSCLELEYLKKLGPTETDRTFEMQTTPDLVSLRPFM